MSPKIPVVLFAYARPEYLKRTLACLRENHVPLIYAFADGPKSPEVEPRVRAVRDILHQVDWCEMRIVEQEKNLGLGTSILTGVSEVIQKHEMILVFEDDLICVPGTYNYLCAALERYKDSPNVMSITGWTHPRVTPSNITDQPYFDGRTDCLVWGTWRRAWSGMEKDSLTLIDECKKQHLDIYRYGADLVEMAKIERTRNIWAVRFSYLHILNKGICLRPPYSLVEHIGYDSLSSNVPDLETYSLYVKLPSISPSIPREWPVAMENPECSRLWQKEAGKRPTIISKFWLFFKNSIRVLSAKIRELVRKLKRIRHILNGNSICKKYKSKILHHADKTLSDLFSSKLLENFAVLLLQEVYAAKYKKDWVYSNPHPHFYNHRIDIAEFAFSEKIFGPYRFYRAFFSAQMIRDGDKLLDIGCGDGFFTRRFFAERCQHVDGIDIEPSAIKTASKYNSAANLSFHLLDAITADFPEKEYEVIVWDGAIAHFPPDSLKTLLIKIASALSEGGVFVGSESLGDISEDHVQKFDSLEDFGKIFSRYFKFVQLYSTSYRLSEESTRYEAYWRCANAPDRLQDATWVNYESN
jgi:2-polyprenyl-3-methyl-5-hydroxy-6-metoxy-1,4-benzoquinol methylase